MFYIVKHESAHQNYQFISASRSWSLRISDQKSRVGAKAARFGRLRPAARTDQMSLSLIASLHNRSSPERYLPTPGSATGAAGSEPGPLPLTRMDCLRLDLILMTNKAKVDPQQYGLRLAIVQCALFAENIVWVSVMYLCINFPPIMWETCKRSLSVRT